MTISKRTDSKGNVSFQAKVRKTGYPTMSKTFKTEAEAQAWERDTEQGIYHGRTAETILGNTTTIGELVERYLKEVTPTKKGADPERFHMRAIQNSPLVKYTVTTLTPQAVREWRDKRLSQVAPSTVNRQLNLLHHIIEHARKEWSISGGPNPVSDVARPKSGPSRDRRLRCGEEARLRAACADTRGGYLEDVIELALETAMRQSELASLLWEQVDFGRRTIRLYDGATKNGEGRGIPMSTKAVEILKRRQAEHPESGMVFPGLTPEALKRSFIRTIDRAGIEDFHFHDLRHEAASRLFEKGLNVMEASSVTGHKDLRMLKRYTHLDASKLADKLG